MVDNPDTSGMTPKMLIADDDPAIVHLLADRCKKMGFQIETASNGMQLLIRARQWKPDVLIVDVNLPELDGLTVCAQLLEPHSKPIETIVITGYSNPETVDRCEGLGAFYARKGPDFRKLIDAALKEIFPTMTAKIEEVAIQATNDRVPEHPRVLVIDDDLTTETLVASRLRKYGVDTLFASDARHGFNIAIKEKPSVVIVENFIPNGDAKYLLHRLRSAPATAKVPVIVVGRRNLDATEQQSLQHEIGGLPGAARVLKKPFDTGELFGAIQHFCSFADARAYFKPPTAASASVMSANRT